MVIKKPKATNPSWGGRFEDSVNELAVSYTSSLDQDKRMYKEDIVGSMKYALALKEAKVITPSDYSKILKGLKTIQKEIESGKFEWKEELEDVHMNIEAALQRKAGNAAKKLHTGRSRNDQVSTDVRLVVLLAVIYVGARAAGTYLLWLAIKFCPHDEVGSHLLGNCHVRIRRVLWDAFRRSRRHRANN